MIAFNLEVADYSVAVVEIWLIRTATGESLMDVQRMYP